MKNELENLLFLERRNNIFLSKYLNPKFKKVKFITISVNKDNEFFKSNILFSINSTEIIDTRFLRNIFTKIFKPK